MYTGAVAVTSDANAVQITPHQWQFSATTGEKESFLELEHQLLVARAAMVVPAAKEATKAVTDPVLGFSQFARNFFFKKHTVAGSSTISLTKAVTDRVLGFSQFARAGLTGAKRVLKNTLSMLYYFFKYPLDSNPDCFCGMS